MPGVCIPDPAGVRAGVEPHLSQDKARGGPEGDGVRTELQRGHSGTERRDGDFVNSGQPENIIFSSGEAKNFHLWTNKNQYSRERSKMIILL